MESFTEKDLDLIQSALNSLCVETRTSLLRTDLGDLERVYLTNTNKEAKELMRKIDTIKDQM